MVYLLPAPPQITECGLDDDEAIPMACMGVTPDREMISMETKNVAMKRKK